MTTGLQPTVFTVDWADPANLKVARQAWTGLFWARGRGLLWVAGVCLVLAGLFLTGGNRLFAALLGLIALIAAAVLGAVYLSFQRRASENAQLSGRALYRLDQQGLHVQIERQSADYAWEAVSRVIEHRDYLGLIMQGGALITIPKRGLPIPAEVWFGSIPAYGR